MREVLLFKIYDDDQNVFCFFYRDKQSYVNNAVQNILSKLPRWHKQGHAQCHSDSVTKMSSRCSLAVAFYFIQSQSEWGKSANGAKRMVSPNRKQKQSEESADVINSTTSREPESSRPTEKEEKKKRLKKKDS